VSTILNLRVPSKCWDVLITELLLALQGPSSIVSDGFDDPREVCGIEEIKHYVMKAYEEMDV
jgi:hypothetical protein